MHGASNQNTHLYPPHNNSSVPLTTTTHVRHTGRTTNGMRSGRTTPQDSFSSPTSAPTPPERLSQEEPGSGLTASTPVSGVSAPSCTNEVWFRLRPVSVAQKNKSLTMLSSNVKSIDLLMDCTAWRLWTMRQSNGCSTPAPRSSGQVVDRTTDSKEEAHNIAVRASDKKTKGKGKGNAALGSSFFFVSRLSLASHVITLKKTTVTIMRAYHTNVGIHH